MKTITIGEVTCPSCGLPMVGNGEKCFHCNVSPYRSKVRTVGTGGSMGSPYYVLGFSVVIGGIVLIVGLAYLGVFR